VIVIPATILLVIFFLLSGLHFHWAFGGRWGLASAIPQENGVPIFTPGSLATALVALALLGAAVVPLWRAGLFTIGPVWLPRAGMGLLAVVFALRAIGDFRYCGFFKRIKGTAFARNDTRLYTPLCALVSALAVWLALMG